MKSKIVLAIACAAAMAAFSGQTVQAQASGDQGAKDAGCRTRAMDEVKRTGGKNLQPDSSAAKAQVKAAYIRCMSR